MQVSRQEVNKLLQKQISHMWYQLVTDIRSPAEAEKILGNILSETELTAITKRLAVGYWLAKNRSYENIKQNLKVSSATIAAVQQDLQKDGWREAVKKMTAEEWATGLEEKIRAGIARLHK